MVSGSLTAVAYETGRRFTDIKSSQELIDIMLPESKQAYVYGVGNTINSQWTGNDFGYNEKGSGRELQLGVSVLNNFDNYLYVWKPDDDEDIKEVYVNHWDLKGNRLWYAENSSQELFDEAGNKITDLSNTTLNKSNAGGIWQEAYGLTNKQTLNVKNSNKIKNGEEINKKKYEYVNYVKNGFNSWDEKIESQYRISSDDMYKVNSSDSKITTIDFYYKEDGGGKTEEGGKKREIFVNHLSTDGTRLDVLANDTQTLLPDRVNVSNSVASSISNGYMEYYSIASNKYMLLRPSSKLDPSKRVKIGDKWYEYDHFNTCSGATYDQALVNNRMTDQKASEYEIKHSNRTTIVTFYYKPVGDIEEGKYETKILGKLAFNSKYNLSGNNSEFIPVNNYLYPYIEGAQKYILPNTNEESTSSSEKGDVVDETKHSYWDDYEEYRSVVIKGDSKRRLL